MFPGSLAAQRREFHHFTVEDGLSQHSVMQIVQDRKGFIWLGTHYGLDRYDGVRFKAYQNDPDDTNSLSDNYINALLVDTRGFLWVGASGRLDRFDPVKGIFCHVLYDSHFVPQSRDVSVNCLLEDHRGNIWVGTPHGLDQIQGGEQRISRVYSFPGGRDPEGSGGRQGGGGLPQGGGDLDNNIRALCEDQTGTLWIGTGTGLIRMDTNGHTAVVLTGNYITSIAEDKTGVLWIGTQHQGVNRYAPRTGKFSPLTGLPSNNIRKILTDRDGRLWIGTQEGLAIADPVSGVLTTFLHQPDDKSSLSQNSIYSICQDHEGSVWVGTYFGGVNVTYATATPFTVYQSGPPGSSINNNVVSGIVGGSGNQLWLGTEGGGLNCLDRGTGRFTYYRNASGVSSSLGSNLVKVLYRDRAGRIWAGTHGGGLNLWIPGGAGGPGDGGAEGRAGGFRHFLYAPNDPATLNSEINAVLLDGAGTLWVGTQGGLKFFTAGGVTPGGADAGFAQVAGPPLSAPLRSDPVRALLEDSRGAVWIGLSDGLFVYDPRSGACRQLGRGTVNCIREGTDGRVWVGMYFGGARVYDGPHWTTYTQRDGLPNNNVIGILEDDQKKLWFSTDNGLARFDPVKGVFKNYTRADGLAANEFNYNSFYKAADGELFVGGYNGVTAFYPERIETNRDTAPLVFTGLRVLDSKDADISHSSGVTLTARQNVFSIDFALLNFIKPGKNKYAYTLEGFDSSWHYTDVPSVHYMNLPAGTYRLLVKGANNDGLWGAPVALSLEVLPPWWKTWWAYALYALATASLFFLLIRFFWIRASLKRDNALHQAKLNFFTNISHEIRTRLTLIAGPIEKLRLEQADSALGRQLAHVSSNAGRLLQLVEELMDFRKAETHHLKLHVSPVNMVAFGRDVFASFGDLALSRRIITDFIATEEDLTVYADPIQLEKVLYNLLSNAFKFTPEGGTISVTVEKRSGFVEVKVTDNGKGIAPEHIDKLFVNFFQVDDRDTRNTGYGIGLALSRSIVQLHKGRLTVESRPDERTCFTVSLRTGYEHFTKEQLVPRVEVEPGQEVLPRLGALPGRPHPDRLPGQPATAPSATDAPGPVAAPRKATLLLVEDNPEVRAFITQALPPEYCVLESPHGAAGWETATTEIPDLVISDVMMPEMDGLTLCGLLKTDPRTNHIPVILLTAKASVTHQVHGLEKGADVYLTKPFSVQVLLLHIRNLLASVETMRRKYGLQLSGRGGESTIPNDFLRDLVAIIEENLDGEAFDIPLLCTKVAMSQSVLYKKVKALTGLSVGDFVRQARFRKAARLLEEGRLSVYEVAYSVGFNDSKYFSREFKKQFGMTPSEYAKSKFASDHT
ncbi:two component regulator with propeller domain [Dinghuibacter silviterrae]|uniref:histidine kinase n=2 Tax=Dinghuibacter silviterrae TaxID=1539049 RepID=A0A4R8DI77_9BACT|nr:two component regulator with propeller domain [Dinghuibacter silviterrae]